MRRGLPAVAAAVLILAACISSAPRSTGRTDVFGVPSTQTARGVAWHVSNLARITEGPAYHLHGDRLSVSGAAPGRGLLVSIWPGNMADMTPRPGRLLLLDPATGKSQNLMGPAAPDQEPFQVTVDRDWVFWGQMSDQDGGPVAYYLYNFRTGVRRPFTDELTASRALSGAVLAGDSLYVAGALRTGACDVTEVLQVHLLRGGATPLVVARACHLEQAPRIPDLPSRSRSQWPLRLYGVTVAWPALEGRDLLLVATPWTDLPTAPPSELLRIDLGDGDMDAVARSPTLIAPVVADKDVVAFLAGQSLYALVGRKLVFVEGTQNPIPIVSGPLVSCGGGNGDVYDVRNDVAYRPPLIAGAWTFVTGGWVSWLDTAVPTYYVARLRPSILK